MSFANDTAGHDLVAAANGLIEVFQARGAAHDAAGVFPVANFDDLATHGLLASAVPKSFGGGGISMGNNDPLPQWLITAAVGAGDLSTARCYEAHVNSVDIMNALAPEALRQEILAGVVDSGIRMSAWLSEPSIVEVQDGGQRFAGGTFAEPVEGGWSVSGTKMYSSGSGGATHAMIAATVLSPDGKPTTDQVWLLLDVAAPGVSIDLSAWKPMGMRASASGRVTLDRVFIPQSRYITDMKTNIAWYGQARILPQFAASFIGGASAAYEFTKAYVRRRQKERDPYVQQHIGEMRVALEVANAFLARTAEAWLNSPPAEAALVSNMCRIVAEQQAAAILDHATHACGSTALLEPHALGRIWRDLQMYMRHENLDRTVATLGRSALGVEFDVNFARIT